METPPPTKSANSKGREKSRPYTSLYLLGLKIGFTTQDLLFMELPRLTCFVREWASMNSTDSEESAVREATQADIDSMLA